MSVTSTLSQAFQGVFLRLSANSYHAYAILPDMKLPDPRPTFFRGIGMATKVVRICISTGIASLQLRISNVRNFYSCILEHCAHPSPGRGQTANGMEGGHMFIGLRRLIRHCAHFRIPPLPPLPARVAGKYSVRVDMESYINDKKYIVGLVLPVCTKPSQVVEHFVVLDTRLNWVHSLRNICSRGTSGPVTLCHATLEELPSLLADTLPEW